MVVNIVLWRGGKPCIFHLALLIYILVFPFAKIQAQNKQAAIWHIGNKRLDFNSIPVTISDVASPFLGRQGSTSIADVNGNLLLFASTQTYTIYNKNYLPVKNGTGIEIKQARHQNIFIPKPENDSLVYCIYGNKYSLIDIKNDTVISKNIVWNTLTSETTVISVYAIHHSNCEDIWLIYRISDGLYSFLITNAGISQNFVSFTPQDRPQNFGVISSSGNMYYMPRISGVPGISIIDFGIFNKNTGEFENITSFSLGVGQILANAFSQDETKIYYTFEPDETRVYNTYQAEIVNGIPDFANAIIINTQTYTGAVAFSEMLLGLDGKIYHSFYLKPKINIIHSPNIAGVACNYQDNAIATSTSGNTMPTFISTWFSNNYCELDFYTENFCIPENTNFYINNITNIQSVLWNFGDSQTSPELNPTHIYANAGTYIVTLEVTFTDNSTQTITKTIEIVDKPTNILIEHE